jgi:hypothetical protein
LKYLGVEHIPAYSPEARGRSERMFGTLQDRLIKELAKAADFIGQPGDPHYLRKANALYHEFEEISLLV